MTTPPTVSAGVLAGSPQPEILAEGGLVLRPWADSDAPVFHEAYADPGIARWHTRQPSSVEEVLAWFRRYREDWAAERGAHWAITRAAGSVTRTEGAGRAEDAGRGRGGEVVGRIALRALDFGDGAGSAAYWVLPAARGAGVAPRALIALSAWAERIGFRRLELEHSTRNEASCRVALKAGFLLEGTRRSSAVHADGRHDMHLHGRVR